MHVTVRSELIQIIIDEDRPYLRFVALDPFQQGPVEDTPEVCFIRNVPEPSAIFSIAARGDERWESATFCSLVYLRPDHSVIYLAPARPTIPGPALQQ